MEPRVNNSATQGQTGRPELVRHIVSLVQERGGRISFAEFMEAALYHPQFGYYQQHASPIGPAGDFYTAVSATPVFGKILARFFQRLETPAVFEFGGHHGQLQADVLANCPGLRYDMIEVGQPVPDEITGVVFSNELIDAMPVHRVRACGGAWWELYVEVRDGQFVWCEGELSDPRLKVALADLPAGFMEDYETEVNLRAQDWIGDIGRRLTTGYVVTIDYGLERHEYFAPHRSKGTLRCYHRHTMTDDPLALVGEQDITSNVEFTSFIEAGMRAGLDLVSMTDLSHFLIKEGGEVIREIAERDAGAISRERQGIHQLIHPGLMGSAFKVLVLRKPET